MCVPRPLQSAHALWLEFRGGAGLPSGSFAKTKMESIELGAAEGSPEGLKRRKKALFLSFFDNKLRLETNKLFGLSLV